MFFLSKLIGQRPEVGKLISVDELSDDEFKQLGTETVIKAFELLESTAWKVEKKLTADDVIYTTTKNIGKVYKLRGKINYPPKKLLYELYYNLEDVPSWNPTLLESRTIKKINDHTDIAYSVSQSGGGGFVKSRDFVNLRCWRLVNDKNIIEDYDIRSSLENLSRKKPENCTRNVLKKSVSEVLLNGSHENHENMDVNQLSKSLGATDITSDDEEQFSDAQQEIHNGLDHSKSIFINAAMSVDYAKCPPTSKYIRGDNIMSCWAMRPVDGDEDSSIFEWLLCIDLKGSLPKYVLNTAFVTLMTDYITHLRKRVEHLNEQDQSEEENEEENENC